MLHEELVQTMKWKQIRGKLYPQLSYLVKVNTPRAVMQETKKAFRKLPNLEQAITALSNLKGVGTTMASGMSSYPSVFSLLITSNLQHFTSYVSSILLNFVNLNIYFSIHNISHCQMFLHFIFKIHEFFL